MTSMPKQREWGNPLQSPYLTQRKLVDEAFDRMVRAAHAEWLAGLEANRG